VDERVCVPEYPIFIKDRLRSAMPHTNRRLIALVDGIRQSQCQGVAAGPNVIGRLGLRSNLVRHRSTTYLSPAGAFLAHGCGVEVIV
jgi:hypothetical protein